MKGLHSHSCLLFFFLVQPTQVVRAARRKEEKKKKAPALRFPVSLSYIADDVLSEAVKS